MIEIRNDTFYLKDDRNSDTTTMTETATATDNHIICSQSVKVFQNKMPRLHDNDNPPRRQIVFNTDTKFQ